MFISADRAKKILIRDRQCLFRVVYVASQNKMIAKINALCLYELSLPNSDFNIVINHAATLKLIKRFISEVIFDSPNDLAQDETIETTRALVEMLEDNHFCCTEIKDKYEYLLIMSLR